MACIWRDTGRWEVVKEKHGSVLRTFVKCARCGAIGFRRGRSRIVHTWQQDRKRGDAK